MVAEISRGYQPPHPLKPLASEWPRKYAESSLVLSLHHIGSIYLPMEMTDAEWIAVEQQLELLKRATLGRWRS